MNSIFIKLDFLLLGAVSVVFFSFGVGCLYSTLENTVGYLVGLH